MRRCGGKVDRLDATIHLRGVKLRKITENDPTRVRNAQVYLRCILGVKTLETPVFTGESGKGTLGTLRRCHLQCYVLEVSDTSIRNVGHINS